MSVLDLLQRLDSHYRRNDCHHKAPDDALEVPVHDLALAVVIMDRREKMACVEVPAEGTEERDFWLEAARQLGMNAVGVHGSYETGEDEILALMAACREQGRRDVLGLPPKEPK